MGIADILEDYLIVVKRMCGEVYADELTFLVEFLHDAPFSCLGRLWLCYLDIVEVSEERVLGLHLLLLV